MLGGNLAPTTSGVARLQAQPGHSSNLPTPKALNYRGLSFSNRGLAPAAPPPWLRHCPPPAIWEFVHSSKVQCYNPSFDKYRFSYLKILQPQRNKNC